MWVLETRKKVPLLPSSSLCRILSQSRHLRLGMDAVDKGSSVAAFSTVLVSAQGSYFVGREESRFGSQAAIRTDLIVTN